MSVESRRAAVATPTTTVEAKGDKGFLTIVAAACALAVLAGFLLLPRLTRGPKALKAAPAFVLPVVHNGDPGSRLSLADLKGKPVLIDFWATWCGPCAMQTPIVDRLARRYEGKVQVVGIDVADDDPAMAKRYAEQQRLAYPIIVDEKGLTQREYGVNKLPSLIIIDGNGMIVHQTSGVVDEATLDRMLREAM
jgi:thiol-disulfide isomerase/thioredoxin